VDLRAGLDAVEKRNISCRWNRTPISRPSSPQYSHYLPNYPSFCNVICLIIASPSHGANLSDNVMILILEHMLKVVGLCANIKYTNSMKTWSWVLPEKLTVVNLLNHLPMFYGTRRFITVFTGVRYWFVSLTRWIKSITLNHISLWSILILSSNLLLGLPSFFHSFFLTKTLRAFLFAPMSATFSAKSHSRWLNYSYYIWRSLTWSNFLQYTIIASLSLRHKLAKWILYLSILLHWYITQVMITVYNVTIYANFNNTIAFDSLKLAKMF
jgi:hypothetical protein